MTSHRVESKREVPFSMKPRIQMLYSKTMIVLSVISALGVSAGAMAETWTAKCHNLEFHYDRSTRRAAILMQVAGGAMFEVATGTIGLDNGVALRATVSPPPVADDDPINEVGLNKSRNIVYLVRHRAGSNEVKDGVFCETPITVSP